MLEVADDAVRIISWSGKAEADRHRRARCVLSRCPQALHDGLETFRQLMVARRPDNGFEGRAIASRRRKSKIRPARVEGEHNALITPVISRDDRTTFVYVRRLTNRRFAFIRT